MALTTDADVLVYAQSAGITVPAAGQAALALLRPMAESAVKDTLKSNIEQATYTHYLPEAPGLGYGDQDALVAGYERTGNQYVPTIRGNSAHEMLLLRELPVRSITAVYENPAAWGTAGGSFPPESLLDPAAYHLDAADDGLSWTGILRRTYGLWCYVPRTVKVTYVAGLTAQEITDTFPEVRLAVWVTTVYHYSVAAAANRSAVLGGIPASVGIEDFSVSLMQATPNSFIDGRLLIPPLAVSLLGSHINVGRYWGV